MLNGFKVFHYYAYSTKTIEIDHNPLLRLSETPMEEISRSLQGMSMGLFKYNFNLVHVPVKNLYIAYALRYMFFTTSSLNCTHHVDCW